MNPLQARAAQGTAMVRLDGRTAFLSGASGWLGSAMAAALAGAGAHVILNSRTEDKLVALQADLEALGGTSSIACFDVADETSVRAFLGGMVERKQRLDILINNASAGRTGTVETATAANFEDSFRTNVTAAFTLVQAALPLLRETAQQNAGGASIVNIASMYGSVSPDPAIYGTSGANNPPFYGSAKGALLQMTRYLACHLAQDRIRVNAISPGPFPIARYLDNDPAFRARLEAKNPMHRIGEPWELAGPLLFLASDASSYVTGIDLPVDGGWTAW